jgi:hypothetical protein
MLNISYKKIKNPKSINDLGFINGEIDVLITSSKHEGLRDFLNYEKIQANQK